MRGDQDGGLYSFRHHSTRANLWTRFRHAATRLHCKIDASSNQPSQQADDVFSVLAKAVKFLQLVSCERWTTRLLSAPVHGRAERGLDLGNSTKDITRMLSSRSVLSFNAWSYRGKLRTNGLAVRGARGWTAPDKLCRRCRQAEKTTIHVISACSAHSREITERHNRIQTVQMDLLWDLEIEAVPNTRAEECGRLVPDITVNVGGGSNVYRRHRLLDEPANMYRAGQEKRDKYGHLGEVFPLVVGASENDAIRTALHIPHRRWNAAMLRMRTSATEDSCSLAK